MSSPVVVQGTKVQQPFGSSPNPVSVEQGNSEHQPAQSGCKDPLFALLFYINVAAIAAVAIIYGPEAFAETTNTGNSYEGYAYAALVSVVISMIFSALGLAVLMCIPETMIKIALIFVVVASGVWAAMAFVTGNMFAGIMGAVFFAIGICYARAVWSRIPFAAVNMTTAVTAIKANLGVTLFAYLFTFIAAGWSILWSVAVSGTLEQTYNCDDTSAEEGQECGSPSYGLIFLLFLSFFFAHQVIQNSVHVTVAGVVGNWWVAPSENGCCGRAVCNSFIRTLTTSFGSICFGSLIVAFLRALEMLAQTARANDDAGIGACIAECILSCLASLVEYFNKWAYVYVGVYGFPYMQAGKEVFTLFKNRGWEAIIADDLVGNALALVSLVVGGIVGALALILVKATDWFADAGSSDKAVAFFIGFVIGLAICSILLSTVASGVNTVIVMFADAPADLQRNYPDISQKMRRIWGEMYPNSV